MPENLYPQLPTAPPISQESFNIEMVRKYYQDIVNLKEKYTKKKRKYKNAYNRLLHASTGASSVVLASGVSTIGTSVTVVGLPISSSLAIVNTVSTCVGACLLLTSKKYKKKLLKSFELLVFHSNRTHPHNASVYLLAGDLYLFLPISVQLLQPI